MILDGALALVTGGASGIGRAAAQLLAAQRAVVVVADVDEHGGQETATLIERDDGRATFRRLDVADPNAVAVVFDEMENVRIVFNCAGLVSGQPDFPHSLPERIARVVAVNVLGTIVVTQASILHMRSGGAVVNVASTAALLPAHADPVYGATKAAVKAFTEQCSRAALARGVRINAVLPGAVDTPILAKTGDGHAPAGWLAPRLAETELLAPEAVAGAMLELACDETRTGESVVIANAT